METTLVRYFFQCTFPSVFSLALLLVFIITDRSFNLRTLRMFLLSILSILLLLIFDAIDYSIYLGKEFNPFRIFSTAMGYILRPGTMAFAGYITFRTSKRNKILYFLPLFINFVFAIFSCFFPLVFYFDKGNNFYRGPFGFMPFLVSGIYLVFFICISIKKFKHNLGESLILLLMALLGIFSVFAESVLKFKFIIPTTISISVVFYYLYLNVQIYKRDALTDLFNRRCFNLFLERNIKKNMIILSMDLNDLKKINDSLGHAEGDQVLCKVSKCMIEAFFPYGKVFRTGGDEFFAIFINKSENSVKNCIKNFKKKIDEIGYSVACGYTIFSPKDNIEEKISLSDFNMYQDKVLIKKGVSQKTELHL